MKLNIIPCIKSLLLKVYEEKRSLQRMVLHLLRKKSHIYHLKCLAQGENLMPESSCVHIEQETKEIVVKRFPTPAGVYYLFTLSSKTYSCVICFISNFGGVIFRI
ncbi:hypothetical protein AMTRI_Chr03g50840 [Amborella trichopoda]